VKQRISAEDLAELTPEQQERLREWWEPEAGDYIVHDTQGPGCLFGDIDIMDKTHMLPRLSIGQCIELLLDKEYQASWGEVLEDISYREGDSELIDVLWEIAKNYAIKEEVGE